MSKSYYDQIKQAIARIKKIIETSDKVSIDSLKDYVRNTYGFGGKVVEQTVDELVRANKIVVEYGIVKKAQDEGVNNVPF